MINLDKEIKELAEKTFEADFTEYELAETKGEILFQCGGDPETMTRLERHGAIIEDLEETILNREY